MEVKNYLTGNTDPTFFLWCLFFAGLGILFVLLMGTKLRDPGSIYSPQRFSWSYLLSDNFKRILASLLAVYLSLRFMPELFGWPVNEWKALLVGMAWDGIALFIKQKSNILDPKDKP